MTTEITREKINKAITEYFKNGGGIQILPSPISSLSDENKAIIRRKLIGRKLDNLNNGQKKAQQEKDDLEINQIERKHHRVWNNK